MGYTGDGKRQRRKVSGTTKAAVVDKLRDLHLQLDKGVTPTAGYAQRAGATITEVEGSHVIMISQPQAVTDVIRQAIDGVTS